MWIFFFFLFKENGVKYLLFLIKTIISEAFILKDFVLNIDVFLSMRV